jgi:hypothetical protein
VLTLLCVCCSCACAYARACASPLFLRLLALALLQKLLKASYTSTLRPHTLVVCLRVHCSRSSSHAGTNTSELKQLTREHKHLSVCLHCSHTTRSSACL